MTAFGDQAVTNFNNRVAPQQGLINFMTGLGGGNGMELTEQARQNARRNAESQERTVGNTGGSIYSVTGHGAMGSSYDVSLRDPGGYNNPNDAANRARIAARVAGVESMPFRQMQSVSAGPAAVSAAQNIDPAFRQQQLLLGRQLMDQANGLGPSVAGSQLRQSTEMNLQAALAQAASGRGGNLGAMQYQLGNARANIQQQAAMQLAQARIQEQMAARQQLGGLLESGRAGDLGVAGLGQQNNQFNAGLQTQNNQFNAGLQQQANGANLNASIQQDQFRQQKLNELLAMGLSYDQATQQADLQARQFGADLFNRSMLGINGMNMQAGAQDMQLLGAGIGAGGGVLTSLSGMMSNRGSSPAPAPANTGTWL